MTHQVLKLLLSVQRELTSDMRCIDIRVNQSLLKKMEDQYSTEIAEFMSFLK